MENPRRVTKRALLVGGVALVGGLFLPTTVDARTKKPGETDDRFSREDTGEFGYRKMGHNFVSASGGVIWRPDHEAIRERVDSSSDWFIWSYLHPFKDLEYYLGASQQESDKYRYGFSVQSDQVSFNIVSKTLNRQQFENGAELQIAWVSGSLALAMAHDLQNNNLPFFLVERGNFTDISV